MRGRYFRSSMNWVRIFRSLRFAAPGGSPFRRHASTVSSSLMDDAKSFDEMACKPPEKYPEIPRNPIIAVIQFTATNDKMRNFDVCSELIRKAKERGAQMVFLPEGFDYLTETSEESFTLSENLSGKVISGYRKLSQELNLWMSLGGYHLKSDKEHRAHNSHIVLDSNGEIAEIYRKAHLFVIDIPGRITLDETSFCIPGSRIQPPVPTPVGKIGLMCCYDLRFPELAGLLTRQGAEILAYPAAFTYTTGVAHWEPLLRARAIENQCYVVAAAQYGSHSAKRMSFGHAMIVDPWGTVIAQCPDGPGIALAEIDLSGLHEVRMCMPVQSHRRHDLYKLTMSPVQLPDFSTEFHNFGGHQISRNEIFYETMLSLALVNLKPIVPGHCLVIPKRVVEKFSDLTYEELGDMFSVVQVVEKMLETRYDVHSSTIACQDGYDAGQTVRHVHVHLLPRKTKDFERDEVYQELAKHDKGSYRRPRTQAEMSAEAREYRKILYGDTLSWEQVFCQEV
ncbi:nitrilase and fragile histidine triad fusion protein NitFhit-like [Paramacrobiotus metropolitanus]|uniref:nitrilase and fragile histidine triad fusion protein NitFhit-like n=1 Tax=Paramacrobiotus metropolitanus TaxID=2943436 RepID=UPI0024463762|nr:nitrilase and fragile histidine triad fusion protein NitFhit-like [Paramacrobiotus metropolitanus]XP_055334234.1 nitrilase and fragile histidine triad fusion protein NitFhit-like [Paramacrobiotus metropolitanus]XP_055334241.1 nitrilase and fragile histidine triad fusion protein NitFhit-like [Paramacrobiotus metropolitanus]